MNRLLICCALALMALPVSASADTVVIKLATLAPKGSSYHKVLKALAAKWNKMSHGQVKVKVFAGGVAGDDSDVVRKSRLGSLSGGMLTSAGMSTIHKGIHALQIPLAYQSYAEVDYVLSKLQTELEKAYLDNGFVVLNWVDAGWVHFFAKGPAHSPDELAAFKMYVWNGNPEIYEIWKAAGFNVVPLPSTEISTALSTGLVNAVPSTPLAANLMQWNKHASYMTNLRWSPLMGALVITKEVWAKVPEALRGDMMKVARLAGRKLRKVSRPLNERSIKAMKARGLQIVEVSDADRAAWAARVAAAKDKIRGDYCPPELYDAALKHLAAYRAKH